MEKAAKMVLISLNYPAEAAGHEVSLPEVQQLEGGEAAVGCMPAGVCVCA